MPRNTNKMGLPASREFHDAVIEVAQKQGLTLTQFMEDALRRQAAVSGDELPRRSAPHGYRHDQVPAGWKSRLYPDRYQVVAERPNTWVFTHLHESPVAERRKTVLMLDAVEEVVEVHHTIGGALPPHLKNALSHWVLEQNNKR